MPKHRRFPTVAIMMRMDAAECQAAFRKAGVAAAGMAKALRQFEDACAEADIEQRLREGVDLPPPWVP